MKNHINDSELELLLLDEHRLSAEQLRSIQEHLKECNLCRENYERIKSFYSYIETNSEESEKNDAETAQRILRQNALIENEKLLDEHKRAVAVYNGSYEIIERTKKSVVKLIGDFVRDNPLKFSGSLALAGALIAVFLYYKKPEIKYVNPSLAVIENNVLKVYNEMGDVLWKKGVPGMADYRTDFSFDNQKALSNAREMLLDDLNGDGINELLITGNFTAKGIFASDTLYCFNNEGRLKWKYGCGSLAKFDTPRWKFGELFIANYFTYKDKTKNKTRLFVIAGSTYAPTKFFELDVKTGKVLQEFYNSGGITTATVFDLNNDGKEKIFIGGINNAFKSAFIAVFDPDSVKGFSPSSDLYIPTVEQKNSASYYILIPHTAYGKLVSLSDYNSVEKFLISKEEKTITAYVQEVPAPGHQQNVHGAILYNFGNDMKLNSIVPADNFTTNYIRLYKAGKLKEPFDNNYTNKLAKKVKYLK
ncbi:hypothetical protein C0389_08140 [bacterium]|nr:hypothetical protein [bacterium]